MNLLLWALGMVNELGSTTTRTRETRSFLMVTGSVNSKTLVFNRKMYCCKYILLIKMIHKSYTKRHSFFIQGRNGYLRLVLQLKKELVNNKCMIIFCCCLSKFEFSQLFFDVCCHVLYRNVYLHKNDALANECQSLLGSTNAINLSLQCNL